jgi:hypothetical protein
VTPQQPFDERPTLTDGKIIDGEIVDGEVIEDLDTQVIHLDTDDVGEDATAGLRTFSMEIDDPPTELGEERAATLHALAAAAGEPPADLRGEAMAEAHRVRRRRYVVTAVTVLALLGLSGTALATGWGSDKTDRLVTASPGTGDPAPAVLPTEVTSTPRASLVPGADTAVDAVAGAPGATATPGGTAPGSGAGAPATGGGVKPVPTPTPGKTQGPPPAPLSVTLASEDPVTAEVGQTVEFTVTWDDGDGRRAGANVDWADGSDPGSSAEINRCSQVPSPRSGAEHFSHKWAEAKTYTVTFSVSTHNCSTYALETRSVTVTVVVTDPAPSPSPPPTPSQGE